MAGKKRRGKAAGASMSLADLKKLVESKEREVEKLHQRRADLQAELDEVDSALRAIEGTRSGPRARGGKAGGTVTRGKEKAGRRAAKGSLEQAIREVLSNTSEAMKLADLGTAVRNAGYNTTSSSFKVILNQRLAKMKDVKRVARGMYALKKS